mmetsp:Transcript_15504/g.18897  ORF Transcript_15504/g.18897 Transcript_15504/m.18897 type:complete len:863 (+) Transcript_15504:425-3013(+)
MAGGSEKTRGRHNTPSQRRFPGLRGRSSSRGRSATPTNITKDENTPKRNFKFKKLIPKSNSRRASSPSPGPKSTKASTHDETSSDSEKRVVETVVVSPKQTRSVTENQNQVQDSPGERDEPEVGSTAVARQTKRIHNASERDGFCRRVDYYDGQTISVDRVSVYEVGNYLGGGVAGVVYEGHRLRPAEEYPVRTSYQEMLGLKNFNRHRSNSILTDGDAKHEKLKNNIPQSDSQEINGGCTGIFCGPSHSDLHDNTNDLKLEVENRYNIEHLNNEKANESNLMDETVAIKILNPVGFRLLSPSVCASAVVIQRGSEMSDAVKRGKEPMTEEHVWWLVNPNSKNLRSLQRNPSPIVANGKRRDSETIGMGSDLYNRGSRDNGIRLSLISAYIDPKTNCLRELPLTRCIEVWGHAPFGTTEEEFEYMMDSIERVNQGISTSEDDDILESDNSNRDIRNYTKTESGLFRASQAQKSTVHCQQLNAFITVPAVPPKYIRWLRQRRAATKEIRNMMRIGRHKNVVHLFEVMELIQDSKSTMFLVLELVKGGELFDLISNNSSGAHVTNEAILHLSEIEQNEYTMLNFFKELASGIAYCHANGIAHRDLKPENLLVHNDASGACMLKIADFGLSSTFVLAQGVTGSDSAQGGFDCGAMNSPASKIDASPPVTGFSPLFSNRLTSALSFLTCGGVEQITECFQPQNEPQRKAKSLQRMTSIVGSPHYVAPEIISQTEDKKPTSSVSVDIIGYDGTKADIWSAGVILYAMLFRSLPFGEDLLQCPRYQSFTKWYNEARKIPGGRRSGANAALTPIDLAKDQNDLGPHWFFPSQTSPESKDIIVAMLNPNPAARLRIQQVLVHPWMKLKFQ